MQAADNEEYKHARRSVLLFSTVVLIFVLAAEPIPAGSAIQAPVIGNAVRISNPWVIYVGVLCVLGFYWLRFYQYSKGRYVDIVARLQFDVVPRQDALFRLHAVQCIMEKEHPALGWEFLDYALDANYDEDLQFRFVDEGPPRNRVSDARISIDARRYPIIVSVEYQAHQLDVSIHWRGDVDVHIHGQQRPSQRIRLRNETQLDAFIALAKRVRRRRRPTRWLDLRNKVRDGQWFEIVFTHSYALAAFTTALVWIVVGGLDW